MKKLLIKEYIVQVFEVNRETTIDKTETKEELAKIVGEAIIEDQKDQPKYIPDKDYNNWCRNELPNLLKEKYEKYLEQKNDSKA